MRNFDRLDMVFIIGDSGTMPWQTSLDQARFLFKMCKKTGKSVFGSGLGYSLQVYFCATAMSEFYVVNNKQKGGALSQLNKVSHEAFSNQKENVFLDSLTGDYYIYNQEQQKWLPSGNVGMHYSRAVESIDNQEQEYLKKKQIYKTHESKYSSQIYVSKLSETKCCIKKQYIGHWLFEDVLHQFLVENRFSWDTHPVNITDVKTVKQNYYVLAESEKSPVIIEHLNTITYVSKDSSQISQMPQRCMTAKYSTKPLQQHSRPTTAGTAMFTTEFQYSGNSISKRKNILVVKNNSVSQDALIPSHNQIQSMKELTKRDSAQYGTVILGVVGSSPSKKQHSLQSSGDKKSKTQNNKHDYEFNQQVRSNLMNRMTQFKNFNKNQQIMTSTNQDGSIFKKNSNFLANTRTLLTQKSPYNAQSMSNLLSTHHSNMFLNDEKQDQKPSGWEIDSLFRQTLRNDLQTVWKKRSDIRQTLHPTLDKNHLPKNPNNPLKMIIDSDNQSQENKIKFNMSNRPFSRFKDFATLPPSNFDIPVIRNSSPYISEEQLRIRHDHLDKQNWTIPGKEFAAFFDKATVNNQGYIQNYVTRDPSQSPFLHKFREENKRKWQGAALKF
eukprot:403361318